MVSPHHMAFTSSHSVYYFLINHWLTDCFVDVFNICLLVKIRLSQYYRSVYSHSYILKPLQLVKHSQTLAHLVVIREQCLERNQHDSTTIIGDNTSEVLKCRACHYQQRDATHSSLTGFRHSFDAFLCNQQNWVLQQPAHCNTMMHGITQRVLNSSARVLLWIHKFCRNLLCLVHDQFHWLRVSECINFTLCTLVYKCWDGTSSGYLRNICRPVGNTCSRCHLWSANSNELEVRSHQPNFWTSSFLNCVTVGMELSSAAFAEWGLHNDVICRMLSYRQFLRL